MLIKTPSTVKPPMAARPSRNHPLARALVGCWLLNEGAGNTVHDVSGYGHDGNFSGTPSWAPGRFGRAIEFDGNDDWISMGDCLDMGTDDVTLLAIVKYSADHQPDQWDIYQLGAIAGKGQLDENGWGYGLTVNTDNTINWEVNNHGSFCDIHSDSPLNDGQYHMAIGVCDRDSSTGVRLYIDGVQQAQTSDPTAFSGVNLNGSKAFSIGSANSEASSWFWDFQGSVAAVCVWKRVLTNSEIRELQRDPFVLFAGRRSPAVLGVSGGTVVTLSGSVTGQATLSGAIRVTRRIAGSTGAAASLSGVLRTTRRLAGTCAATTTAAGSLSTVRLVRLSGSTGAVSALVGRLRSSFVQPLFQATLPTEMPWLRGALFNGMTPEALKLGTVLTQGWFWTRRLGCTAVYRGPDPASVDFSNIVHVTAADATEVCLPSYLSHDPDTPCCYVVRRFNSCGLQERTTGAAVILRTDPDGQLAPPMPNTVFGLRSEPAGDGKIRLLWFYCPLDEQAAPQKCEIYGDNGTGQVDLDNTIAVLQYQGRRFYGYHVGAPVDGVYAFAVRATSATHVKSPIQPSPLCEVRALAPESIQILAAEVIL